MFVERLSEEYRVDEPIFTEEVQRIFPEYSRAQIFRYIKEAKANRAIIQFDKGVYYIPRKTFMGTLSTITPDDVVEKKYVRNKDEIYGVYSGIKLLNMFSVTTQMATTIELVSNNETTRRREICYGKRCYILRKSRIEITSDNFAAYTLLQLFSEMTENDINENFGDSEDESRAFLSIKKFVKQQAITSNQVCDMAEYFPARAIKNLVRSKVIYGLA